jgi:hypothetical protein
MLLDQLKTPFVALRQYPLFAVVAAITDRANGMNHVPRW